MKQRTISLTEHIDVSSGAHILYTYESKEGYADNAAAFLLTGIQLGQHVVLVDSEEHRDMILQRLSAKLDEEQLSLIYFVDSRDFYCKYGRFDSDKVLANLEELFEPLVLNKKKVRSWGHVIWEDQDDIFRQLEVYECACRQSVKEMRMLAVCAYNSDSLSAFVQNRMLRSHEYFMTDEALVRSPLYANKERQIVFPSLSVHTRMQSEVDFYKQKLDFVHVVSHEVRNPLTVIKAYASMLLPQELDPAKGDKLRAIMDYVEVIDNEVTHIINTEQMLSSEALWTKSMIEIRPIVEQVVAVMETKARTQSIQLQSEVQLVSERLQGNRIGLKLIISNLLSNAIKYSEEGGAVRLSAFHEGGRIRLVIEDSGAGMSREQLDKLFLKYEKTNTDKSGQGIGLYMVKKLLDHIGGTIRIESELHRGTIVYADLPLELAADGEEAV
ncbi:MEDS domain-containing protein [Paenibacillus sp. YYML68]|uniref:MEDS domain-containing protein n=1 Tax=Paenibacillus sp. YYML68 TaxID=2909250 RepID=UPI0024937E75|nr:MEDS domain-containing protein [Paenibacillus sp. YYML68]